MKFRKKPVVIEAWKWEGEPCREKWPAWLEQYRYLGRKALEVWTKDIISSLTIPTLEGDMCAAPGDWIILGVKGEIYPCKPDIFALTYEPAPEGGRP